MMECDAKLCSHKTKNKNKTKNPTEKNRTHFDVTEVLYINIVYFVVVSLWLLMSYYNIDGDGGMKNDFRQRPVRGDNRGSVVK